MISSSQRSKIARFFPEMTVEDFISRFVLLGANANINTLSDCQILTARIVGIAQDLSAEQAFEEQEAIEKQERVDDVINQIIYACSMKKAYTYIDPTTKESISNMDEAGVLALTNDSAKKAFASVVVRNMIRNKELEDPLFNSQRAAILKSFWYGLIETGKRIENWSMSESAKLKRM